jgi:MerR family transcriptional regulator, thiopeptide resistance regulator
MIPAPSNRGAGAGRWSPVAGAGDGKPAPALSCDPDGRGRLIDMIEKQRKTGAVIRALDRMLESLEKAKPMNTEELFEGMEAFADAPREIREHQAKHAQEVQERWGKTSAYEESMRRAKSYSKADWQGMKAEAEDHGRRLAEALRAGHAPDSAEAMDLAEEHRQHISRWFYDCSYEMQRGLAEMYVADQRFADTYEQIEPGLAAYVREAVLANADRAEGDGS